MKKKIEVWTVERLRETFDQIDFPEYQREPNLWSLAAKQRLIDSMSRRFDIAPLYFYKDINGSIGCVDGRQRVGAIMSFLGKNDIDADAGFQFQHFNEIYSDEPPFESLVGKPFSEIEQRSRKPDGQLAHKFVGELLEYELTVVILSDSKEAGEFNLQFTRLNLGVIINSGEKLHAMLGDLRNKCFGDPEDECSKGLGRHTFLEETNIPTRRYATELVAAQILANIFSLDESEEFTRTRHFDLQRLFKENDELSVERSKIIEQVNELFDLLKEPFGKVKVLRNRAITVSTVLLAWTNDVTTPERASELAEFIEAFVCRLNWQVGKGPSIDPEYQYLLRFQRGLTQGSAEKSSVEERAALLTEELSQWRNIGQLSGDREWTKKYPDRDPNMECQNHRFPEDYRDFKKPILFALRNLGGVAFEVRISEQIIEDLNLPSVQNVNFWDEKILSRKKQMRSRKYLYEDRIDLAFRKLKEDNILRKLDEDQWTIIENDETD